MTKFIILFAAQIVFAFGMSAAYAADCMLTIDRTPCPGKDAEARKPYAGKNPTEEKTKAKDAEACTKNGERAAKIIRKGTLGKKVVTIKFGDKDLGTKEDTVACN